MHPMKMAKKMSTHVIDEITFEASLLALHAAITHAARVGDPAGENGVERLAGGEHAYRMAPPAGD